MAAVGVVGRGSRDRSKPKQIEISLAGAVCLPRCDRRISLHRPDVIPLDCIAGNQIVGRNSKNLVGRANARWCGTRLRVIGPRVARNS